MKFEEKIKMPAHILLLMMRGYGMPLAATVTPPPPLVHMTTHILRDVGVELLWSSMMFNRIDADCYTVNTHVVQE